MLVKKSHNIHYEVRKVMQKLCHTCKHGQKMGNIKISEDLALELMAYVNGERERLYKMAKGEVKESMDYRSPEIKQLHQEWVSFFKGELTGLYGLLLQWGIISREDFSSLHFEAFQKFDYDTIKAELENEIRREENGK